MLDITFAVFFIRFLTSWTIFFLLTTEKNRMIKAVVLTLIETILYHFLHIPFVVMEPLMMLIYRKRAFPDDGLYHLIYYISFPIVITSLFSSLMIFFFFPLLFNMSTLAVWNSPEMELLSYLCVVPVLTFVEQVFSIDSFRFKHDYLQVIYRLLIISDVFLLIYLTGFYYFEVNNYSGGYSFWLSKLLILFFIFTFLFLSSYINHYGKVMSERYVDLVEKQYLLALENYNSYIERTYQHIRSFKHDYENMMLSLAGSLEQNDPKLVRRISSDILLKLGQDNIEISQFYQERFNQLHDKDLEFFLSLEFYEMMKSGVDTHVDIINPISSLNMSTMDLIVLLRTIFDFAKASLASRLYPRVDFLVNSDRQGNIYVIIKFSYDNKIQAMPGIPMEIVEQNNLIFDYYTDKYPNVFIYREESASDYHFRIHMLNSEVESKE